MAIFNSYVSLPEDNHHVPEKNAVKPDLVLTTLVSMAMIHDSVNPIFSTPLVPPIIFLINIP